jgi:flagellar motor switch protein FliN/FliY
MSRDKTANGTGPAAPKPTDPLLSLDSPVIRDLEVGLDVSVGEVRLTIGELLALQVGAVLKLGSGVNDLVDVQLNGVLVARGELVAVDDNLGVRIAELEERAP